MKLVKVNRDDYKCYKKTKNQLLIDEFIESGYEMVRVEGFEAEYKDAYSCSSSLRTSIHRFNYSGITAKCIKNEVFLIRLEGENNEATKD